MVSRAPKYDLLFGGDEGHPLYIILWRTVSQDFLGKVGHSALVCLGLLQWQRTQSRDQPRRGWRRREGVEVAGISRLKTTENTTDLPHFRYRFGREMGPLISKNPGWWNIISFGQIYYIYINIDTWQSILSNVLFVGNYTLEQCLIYLRSTPHPVTVTTRSITCLVGNPYKPSFATVTGWGVYPRYTHIWFVSKKPELFLCFQAFVACLLGVENGICVCVWTCWFCQQVGVPCETFPGLHKLLDWRFNMY